jgi:hypothetical protein
MVKVKVKKWSEVDDGALRKCLEEADGKLSWEELVVRAFPDHKYVFLPLPAARDDAIDEIRGMVAGIRKMRSWNGGGHFRHLNPLSRLQRNRFEVPGCTVKISNY